MQSATSDAVTGPPGLVRKGSKTIGTSGAGMSRSRSEGDLNSRTTESRSRRIFNKLRAKAEKLRERGLQAASSLLKPEVNPLGEYPSPFSKRVLFLAFAPLLPLVGYAIYTLLTNKAVFFYLLFLYVHFMLCAAYGITEIAIRPPWYHYVGKGQALSAHDLPAYWQGIAKDPRSDHKIEYEDVEFATWGGLTLRGWLVPGKGVVLPPAPSTAATATATATATPALTVATPSAPADSVAPPPAPALLATGAQPTAAPRIGILFVHGGGLDRRSWLRHLPFFHSEGYSCLMFDFSGHGCSDGGRRGFSYGVREKEDVCAAARYMRMRGIDKVIAIGTSVGGASVIQAGAQCPAMIDGIIAENPVAEPQQFAVEHLRKMISSYGLPRVVSLLLVPFYRIVVGIFLLRIGAFFNYRSPLMVVREIAPRPLLLIHGSLDDTVPMGHSQKLFEVADEPKSLWIAQDAWHCAVYDKYPQEFKRRVREFMFRHFGAGDPEKMTTPPPVLSQSTKVRTPPARTSPTASKVISPVASAQNLLSPSSSVDSLTASSSTSSLVVPSALPPTAPLNASIDTALSSISTGFPHPSQL